MSDIENFSGYPEVDLLPVANDSLRRMAEANMDQALYYAYGYMDAQPKKSIAYSTDYAYAFAHRYYNKWVEFATEQTKMLPSVENYWQQYLTEFPPTYY